MNRITELFNKTTDVYDRPQDVFPLPALMAWGENNGYEET